MNTRHLNGRNARGVRIRAATIVHARLDLDDRDAPYRIVDSTGWAQLVRVGRRAQNHGSAISFYPPHLLRKTRATGKLGARRNRGWVRPFDRREP